MLIETSRDSSGHRWRPVFMVRDLRQKIPEDSHLITDFERSVFRLKTNRDRVCWKMIRLFVFLLGGSFTTKRGPTSQMSFGLDFKVSGRIIPSLGYVVFITMVNFRPLRIGLDWTPSIHGRTLWLINGADPNHLQVLG